MLIGLGENTIPDVFKLTRSNVKLTLVTLVINYVNSTKHLKILIIKPEGTYAIPIHKVTSCQSSHTIISTLL